MTQFEEFLAQAERRKIASEATRIHQRRLAPANDSPTRGCYQTSEWQASKWPRGSRFLKSVKTTI